MKTSDIINRREAVERITLLLGGAVSTQLSAGLMGQVINHGPSVEVTPATEILLAEVADVIIPTTDTPGAKTAGVEKFIIRLMRDCYVIADQRAFYGGLAKLESSSKATHGKSFVALDLAGKTGIVEKSTKADKAFFKQMKQLTVAGYFTSEIGATQALAYLPIPGKFEGDLPMSPGQKAWAISK